MSKEVLVGGMAVLEGVMMRGPKKIATAVRRKDNSITTSSYTYTALTEKYKFLGWPFIRGVVGMLNMMYIGIKALNFSTKIALEDEEDQKGAEKAKKSDSNWMIYITIAFSLLFSIVLFKFLPLGATQLLTYVLPATSNHVLFNIVEGLIKIFIFVGYLWLISLLPDIKRLFAYHGAEHKTVYCHEKKLPLTVENVKKQSCLHPRCGTSFMIFVVLLSIILYMFIPGTLPFWLKFAWRILLLPVLAGISFEILVFSAKNPNSVLFKAISAPGLWTQLITTNEPDKKQIEVAIKALKVSLK